MSNNPDKDLAETNQRIRDAVVDAKLARLSRLENGTSTAEDRLEVAFPDAKSKSVVEFEGARWQRRYVPAVHSRSRKTVTLWEGCWVRVETEKTT